MKYYYHPASTNCRKVSTVIELLGIDVKYEFVDLFKGKQAQSEYLAVNRNGMVPVLVDGTRTVVESNCILIYLAEKTDSELWPEEHRLEILQWMFWEQSHFMYATGLLFFQKLIKPMMGKDPDETRIEESMAKFRRHAKALDQHLNERDWLACGRDHDPGRPRSCRQSDLRQTLRVAPRRVPQHPALVRRHRRAPGVESHQPRAGGLAPAQVPWQAVSVQPSAVSPTTRPHR